MSVFVYDSSLGDVTGFWLHTITHDMGIELHKYLITHSSKTSKT